MRIGSVELAPLVDSIGEFPDLADPYPDASAEDWAPYRELYPELFGPNGWRIPCMSFLVRSGGRTILVDTGTGPPGFWDEAPGEGRGRVRPLSVGRNRPLHDPERQRGVGGGIRVS